MKRYLCGLFYIKHLFWSKEEIEEWKIISEISGRYKIRFIYETNYLFRQPNRDTYFSEIY